MLRAGTVFSCGHNIQYNHKKGLVQENLLPRTSFPDLPSQKLTIVHSVVYMLVRECDQFLKHPKNTQGKALCEQGTQRIVNVLITLFPHGLPCPRLPAPRILP